MITKIGKQTVEYKDTNGNVHTMRFFKPEQVKFVMEVTKSIEIRSKMQGAQECREHRNKHIDTIMDALTRQVKSL